MKLTKLFSAVTICITFCMTFTSCKKDNQPVAPAPVCRITTLTSTSPGGGAASIYTIAYNEDGTTSSITIGNSVTTFTYSGNTIIETAITAGAFSSKKTITQNAAGFATNILTETNTSGTVWNNQAQEYNGTELTKSTFTSSSAPTPSVSTFTWSAGNLVSITSATSSSTLDYYTDKPSIPGDYLQLSNLVGGAVLYKTKNSLKSITSPGPSVTSFVYDYSADGKITKVSISVGVVVAGVYSYDYTCK
jgi:hypothetical protein